MRLQGQNLRILMFDTTANKYKVIGMATNCTINLNTNQEDSTTKDDIGLAAMPTIASKSWSVQVDSLNVVDAATILSVAKNMTKITLMWDKVTTTDNQTPAGAAYARGGQAYVSDLTLTFNDRENSAKNITFTGYGRVGYRQFAEHGKRVCWCLHKGSVRASDHHGYLHTGCHFRRERAAPAFVAYAGRQYDH